MPSTLGIVASGAPSFSPLNLSPAVWLDAADLSTITSSGSPAKVSQWDDKSGNGRHVVQATGAAQPTTGASTQNGLNVLSFGGSQDLKKTSLGLDSDITVVALFKVSTATTFTMPSMSLTSSNLGRPFDRWHSLTANLFLIGGDVAGSSNTSLRAWTTFATWLVTYSKTTSTTPRLVEYKDNVQVTSINSAQIHSVTGQTLSIGRRDDGVTTLDGLLAEVLVFPSILSSDDRSDLQTYLATKWGL